MLSGLPLGSATKNTRAKENITNLTVRERTVRVRTKIFVLTPRDRDPSISKQDPHSDREEHYCLTYRKNTPQRTLSDNTIGGSSRGVSYMV